MIISASRRTDIPRYFSKWFYNRIEEGFLYIRNPINIYQVSKLDLSTDLVDCIVFWTKNPKPMMNDLDKLKDYNYYFQFSLTGYGKDLETGIPDKKNEMIPIFQELSDKIGKKRVVWRYDPIIFTEKYNEDYHLKAFEEIAKSLNGYCEKVVISFVDMYAKTARNMKEFELIDKTKVELTAFSKKLAEIAKSNGLLIETCAEVIDLDEVGITHSSCIDKKLIEEIIDGKIKVKKDTTQREECGCVDSIDIGAYNTCSNGCKYCYANFNQAQVVDNLKMYDVNSPILCGELGEKDKVTERKVKSLRDNSLDNKQVTIEDLY